MRLQEILAQKIIAKKNFFDNLPSIDYIIGPHMKKYAVPKPDYDAQISEVMNLSDSDARTRVNAYSLSKDDLALTGVAYIVAELSKQAEFLSANRYSIPEESFLGVYRSHSLKSGTRKLLHELTLGDYSLIHEDHFGKRYIELTEFGAREFRLAMSSALPYVHTPNTQQLSTLPHNGQKTDFVETEDGGVYVVGGTKRELSILALNVAEAAGNTPEYQVPDSMILGTHKR